MKIRLSFVSNSSSCSFIVSKKDSTAEQKEQIRNHSEVGKEMGFECAESDPWFVDESYIGFLLATDMDNFDMQNFLEEIKVPAENIEEGPEGFLFMQGYFENMEENINTPSHERLEKLLGILQNIFRCDYDPYLTEEEIKEIKEIEEIQERKKKAVGKRNFKKAADLVDKIKKIEMIAKDKMLDEIKDMDTYILATLKHAIELEKNHDS